MKLHVALGALLVLCALPSSIAEDPYYAKADVHPAKAQGGYEAKADCSQDPPGKGRPLVLPGGVRSAGPPDVDPEHPSLARAVPTCIIVQTPACGAAVCLGLAFPVFAHAAYNTTSGRFAGYAYLPLAAYTFSGDSGVGLMFDCEECPPPVQITP